MSYYPDSHTRNKFKEVLELSNYTTKKELDNGAGVIATDLASKF